MAPLGYPKSNSKLPLPKLTGLAWAPGNWEAGLSRNWLSVNVATPPHTHTHTLRWVARGLVLKHLNLLCTLLSLPQEPPPGYPARANGSPPLKDLKRPQASATYLNPHPARTPIPVGTGVPGWTRGRRGRCLFSPYLLVTGHTSQELSHALAVLQTRRRHRGPGTPHPKFGKESAAGLWASSGSASPSPVSLSAPSPCPPFPFPLRLACLLCVSKPQLLSFWPPHRPSCN